MTREKRGRGIRGGRVVSGASLGFRKVMGGRDPDII